ncbi:MAG: SurA N-terminal domain-containing protein, partial [Pseudomonadota bacterium]|nr:SurA N-terminal domain-containing protein [Pseudomonadota bacterium]
MLTAIGKFSKSLLIKIFVGIIILPFIFWGMGDVFRGGNQNIIASIDSEKVSTKEFVNYLRRLNLQDEQIKNLSKTNLVEKILSEYIGKKVMALEIERLGITVNDSSLRYIIKNDKTFFKKDKFSRTEYEKFLLKSGVSAPQFEANIAEQEKRRQFLSSISGGIVIPDFLVKKEFRKENQSKIIRYIDLDKYYSKNKPSEKKKKELYEKNKNIFVSEFKTIRFAEITPEKISGNKEYNESFFKQLDIIENNILDGQSFDDASKNDNLKVISINKINSKKEDENKKKVTSIPDDLFKKIYNLKNINAPQIINFNNQYYLVDLEKVEKKIRPYNDIEVQEALNAQLNFTNKIEKNSSILKDISMGAFDKDKLEKFASDNGLMIKEYEINDFKQNEIFSEE